MMDTTVVRVCNNAIEAEIIAGLLREAGIPVMVTAIGGAESAYQLSMGSNVLVPMERLEEARRVLLAQQEPDEDEDLGKG